MPILLRLRKTGMGASESELTLHTRHVTCNTQCEMCSKGRHYFSLNLFTSCTNEV